MISTASEWSLRAQLELRVPGTGADWVPPRSFPTTATSIWNRAETDGTTFWSWEELLQGRPGKWGKSNLQTFHGINQKQLQRDSEELRDLAGPNNRRSRRHLGQRRGIACERILSLSVPFCSVGSHSLLILNPSSFAIMYIHGNGRCSFWFWWHAEWSLPANCN